VLVLPFALAACGFDAGGTGEGARVAAATDSGSEPLDTFAAVEDSYVEPAETAPLFETGDEDATADSPLPGCTAETHGGHEYLFCELVANWDQARTSCQVAGYDLVIVNDKGEHDWIVGKLKAKSKGQWHIGLNDRDSEGNFKWVDGTSPSFTSWATWEPNNFLFSEDCAVTTKDGAWNDSRCGDDGPREAFICETL
jgi:hypothetical protein